MTIKRRANQPINIRIVSEQQENAKQKQNESATLMVFPELMSEDEIKERFKDRNGIYPAQVCTICKGDVFSHGVCVNCVNG